MGKLLEVAPGICQSVRSFFFSSHSFITSVFVVYGVAQLTVQHTCTTHATHSSYPNLWGCLGLLVVGHP